MPRLDRGRTRRACRPADEPASRRAKRVGTRRSKARPRDDGVRTVIYSMGVSLDGYIAGPDGDGWGVPDAELHRFHNEQTSELGLHLLGRRLYEVMVFWETAEERRPSTPGDRLRARRGPARVRTDLEAAAEAGLLDDARGSRGKRAPLPCRSCAGRSCPQGRGGRHDRRGRRRARRDSHSAPAHRRVPPVRLPRGPRRRQALLRRRHSCRPRAPRDTHIRQPRRLPPLPAARRTPARGAALRSSATTLEQAASALSSQDL